MVRVGAAIRPLPGLDGVGASARALALTAVAAAGMASLAVAGAGPFVRVLFAIAFSAVLILLVLTEPAAGMFATVVYLILLAFMRRLLIPATGGWVSADPMLLVGPVVAVVLLIKLFALERRSLAPDPLSVLVLAVLVITILEVPNPAGRGIAAGITGLLFMAVPLLWFFVGRELLTDRLTDRLFATVVVLALAIGAYGVVQTQFGFPSWDSEWVNLSQLSSLNVLGEVRAFGTFSSFVEYAFFLGCALAVAVSFVLRGRALALLAVPPLAAALFLSSHRSALLLSITAIVVMCGLRTRRPLVALVVTVLAFGLGFGALKVFGSKLSGAGAASGNALVSHQLGGLGDPLNPDQSTFLVHFQLVKDGFESAVSHPLGKGPAVTNNASGIGASAFDQTQATEVDFSNAFVALGAPGGALYLAVVVLTLVGAIRSYFRGRDAMLPVIGVLVASFGQWLTGGHYAVSPLTWLLIGSVAATAYGAAAVRARRN
jgi:hypothetical protein